MSINESQRRAIERMEMLDPAMVRVWQAKSPAERLTISHGMWRSAREMLRNLTKAEHPDWSDDEVSRTVAERLGRGTR